MLRAAWIAAALLALAACGGTATRSAPPEPVQQRCPATQRALAKIGRDLGALRAAAKQPTADRLKGNHAINVATDRFLDDVALAPISNLQRNRLIDHAMAALSNSCEQCFLAFESARPIPAIRQGDSKCPST